MSKGKDAKKQDKKKPQKTLMEKRAAKRAKKENKGFSMNVKRTVGVIELRDNIDYPAAPVFCFRQSAVATADAKIISRHEDPGAAEPQPIRNISRKGAKAQM